LEEKSITIIMYKSYDRKYALARKILETDTELDNIQETLLNYALMNWKEIYEAYHNIEPTERLYGRYFLLWAPILSICKVTYPERYENMIKYAEEATLGVERKSFEIENRVLGYLLTHRDEIKSKGNAIYLKDLTEALNVKWWQNIFDALRNLGLIKKAKDTSHGKKYYLHIERVVELARERSIEEEETDIETIKNLSQVEEGFCELCGERKWLDHEWRHGEKTFLICSSCVKDLKD